MKSPPVAMRALDAPKYDMLYSKADYPTYDSLLSKMSGNTIQTLWQNIVSCALIISKGPGNTALIRHRVSRCIYLSLDRNEGLWLGILTGLYISRAETNLSAAAESISARRLFMLRDLEQRRSTYLGTEIPDAWYAYEK
jgi:hypothetical protein